MAVSLKKGQAVRVNNNSLRMVLIGLGWDPNKKGGDPFDLDLSAFVCGANGKALNDYDFVYYNNKDWRDHTIWSTGDDRFGNNSAGGDDEKIFIDLARIPDYVSKIVITVTMHEAKMHSQTFGQVSNSYVKVMKVNSDKDKEGQTVIRFDLENEFFNDDAIVVCEILRLNGSWIFHSVAEGFTNGLGGLCHLFGIEVAD